MPRRDAVKVMQMDEKCILLSKAQAVGEAEERVFDDRNRRPGAKSKGGKRSAEAVVVRKEAPMSKFMGKTSRRVKAPAARKVTEVLPLKGMPAEVPPLKSIPVEVSAEVPPVTTSMPEVSAEVPPMTAMPAKVPAVASPVATKSQDVSCRRKDNKAGRNTDSNKPFHIPLLRVTPRGDNPWRFEVEPIPLPQPPACFHSYSSFLTP